MEACLDDVDVKDSWGKGERSLRFYSRKEGGVRTGEYLRRHAGSGGRMGRGFLSERKGLHGIERRTYIQGKRPADFLFVLEGEPRAWKKAQTGTVVQRARQGILYEEFFSPNKYFVSERREG